MNINIIMIYKIIIKREYNINHTTKKHNNNNIFIFFKIIKNEY